MSWLKENSFLAGTCGNDHYCRCCFGLPDDAVDDAVSRDSEAYTQAVRKLHALQNRSPFPNAENFEKSRALEEQYKSELDSLRARLAKMQTPVSPTSSPRNSRMTFAPL